MSLLRVALCGALALAVWTLAPPPDALRAGLALFALIGALWLTQALPLAVTALAVPLLATLSGVLPLREALAAFADPIIFLFLGGFALAAALSQHGIDRALARAVLHAAGGRRWLSVLMLAALTALLSMWISNTATVAMMLPLAQGLLRDDDAAPGGAREQAFVLLALAYSASIGGMATLIGSPPNAIAAAQTGLGFTDWLKIGLPLTLLLWPAMLVVLALLLRPRLNGRITPGVAEPFLWTRARVAKVLIFALTALGWIFGAPLARALGLAGGIDSVVAIAAILALTGSGSVDWRQIERNTEWGVLVLFGGGLALSEVAFASGASRFLAEALLDAVGAMPSLLLLICVVAFVVFMTELVSNTASAALLLPIFLPVAAALDLPPVAMAAAIALAASCAFMLPVATPPNAIVFASGQVPQSTMMRCGLVLNIVAIVIVSAVCAWRGW